MDEAFDESVVTEREKSLTFRVSRVPTAEGSRFLVREKDKVLSVVEHGLSPVMLGPRCAGACVANKASTSCQLPQLDERVFAAGEEIFRVVRELDGADFGAVMSLGESVDASIRDSVP